MNHPAIAQPRGLAALPQGVTATPTALKLPDDLAFEDCVALCVQFGQIVNTSAWAVGDLAEFAQFVYGAARYEEVVAAFGLDREVVRDRQWVSASVPLRSERLSWTHHRAVAGLDKDEQGRWLRRALDEKLSVKQLRDSIREARMLPRRNGSVVYEQLRFPAERAERWKAAAEHAGTALEEWAAAVLDIAAEAA